MHLALFLALAPDCPPALQELGELVAAMPSPLGPQQDGKAQASGEGADFTVAEITDILPEIKVWG
jgi:hypothetical protein